MTELVPAIRNRTQPTRLGAAAPRLPRQTSRALAALEQRTMLRQAGVLAESVVQLTKLQEIDRLAREAASGQAMLVHWRESLAAGDPLLNDELRYFTDLARLGKGEILMDTITTYCRESNR